MSFSINVRNVIDYKEVTIKENENSLCLGLLGKDEKDDISKEFLYALEELGPDDIDDLVSWFNSLLEDFDIKVIKEEKE